MNFSGLGNLLLIYFILLCAYFAFSWTQMYLSSVFGQKITWQLRVDLMKYLMSLKVDFFSRNPVGKLVTRVTNDVANLNEMISAGFVSLIADVFLLVSIFIMMLLMNLAPYFGGALSCGTCGHLLVYKYWVLLLGACGVLFDVWSLV